MLDNTHTKAQLNNTSLAISGFYIMSEHTLFRISGPDAVTFLQGQLTADIEKLNIHESTFAAHCNAKGRMISSFLIFRESNDSFLFRVKKHLFEHASTALKKYIVFSKAELKLVEDIQSIALLGENAVDVMEKIQASAEVFVSLKLDASGWANHYVELLLTREQLAKATPILQSLSPQTENERVLAQSLHGIAEVNKPEKFLPQELNFDQIGAVSFKKGCYTGQEVIARLHYRGSLKKHLRVGRCAYAPIESGTKISAEKTGDVCGEIVSSSSIDQKTSYFLALVNDENAEHDICVTPLSTAAKIEWLPLPYAIT